MLNIRNFAIIAHIDHGKSTLADRLLEITGTVAARDFQEQILDSHPVSRERGITIRLAPVTMHYKNYILNLIDTPGHVDFSYEVERSLAACEGAILLIDATQGVQAQTISHLQKAQKLGLTIIPVINKIDMPSADINNILQDFPNALQISAKTGQGIKGLLEEIINKIPAPKSNYSQTRALIFSSQYDPARGVTTYIRVVDGQIKSKDKINFLATGADGVAFEIGHFTPNKTPCDLLETGEVGYVSTNLKDPSLVHVGDTIGFPPPLHGYIQPKPMVFVSFFPVDQNDFKQLEDALDKLKLNDAALSFNLTGSKALGRGYKCGFLGHLHAEVTQERLESDSDLSIIATTPTVENKDGMEPWVKATIICPNDFIGAIMNLCEDRRGKLVDMTYHGKNIFLEYELPLAEIITDFFDQLKSFSSGFASLDYEFIEFRPFDFVQLDIVINYEPIDAFSQILERKRAQMTALKIVSKLKEIIPRQQIPIPIQASIDNQIVARETIPAYRKDVTAKLYGGDFTRRLKLLEKQKKGKKKMKSIGKIEIPNDTFLKIFRT